MARFFIALILTAILLGSAVFAAGVFGVLQIPSFFLSTLALLTGSTGLIYRYLHKADSGAFFVQMYLLTMVIKVLAYGTYNLIMILRDKASAVENVVFFMVTYFIFTALEIGFLHQKILTRRGP